MRRKDREITDSGQIDEIILNCDCLRLGMADGGEVYIVPLNFGFTHEGEKRSFYFHSAAEGRKIDLLRKNGRVGFELDTGHAVNAGETACGYSFRFQSVTGTGTVSFVVNREEKAAALRQLMLHYAKTANWPFDCRTLDAVTVFRLDVETLACKKHE